MSAVVTGAEILLPLKGLIDLDQEIERLEKELKILNSEVIGCKRNCPTKDLFRKLLLMW